MSGRLRVAALLLAGLAASCGPASPAPSPGASAPTSPAADASDEAPAASPAMPPSSPWPPPAYEVIAGPRARHVFEVATDGSVIAWSSGATATTAPNLWVFDPATRSTIRRFHSPIDGAILANLAVRDGRVAFTEVTPATVGTGSWRLILLDAHGTARVLDRDDPPARQGALLAMPALSDRGILWAASHASRDGVGRCELRYASFRDLDVRVLRSAPCDRTEFWFPRSDGRQFVYGTVEYGRDGTADDRHVYLVTDRDLAPRRLDADGEASLPDVLDSTVIWKTADRAFNMLNVGRLVTFDLRTGESRLTGFRPGDAGVLTTPTIGRTFLAAESSVGTTVEVWDRAASRRVVFDRIEPTDPGFFAAVRLSGDLLAWIYAGSVSGGGEREIRWVDLAAP